MPKPTRAPTTPPAAGGPGGTGGDRGQGPAGDHRADGRQRPGDDPQAPQGPGTQPGRGAGDGALLGHGLLGLLGVGALLVLRGDADLIVVEAGVLQLVDGALGLGVTVEDADDGVAGGAVGGGSHIDKLS